MQCRCSMPADENTTHAHNAFKKQMCTRVPCLEHMSKNGYVLLRLLLTVVHACQCCHCTYANTAAAATGTTSVGY
jgi:hypothetical protein